MSEKLVCSVIWPLRNILLLKFPCTGVNRPWVHWCHLNTLYLHATGRVDRQIHILLKK